MTSVAEQIGNTLSDLLKDIKQMREERDEALRENERLSRDLAQADLLLQAQTEELKSCGAYRPDEMREEQRD